MNPPETTDAKVAPANEGAAELPASDSSVNEQSVTQDIAPATVQAPASIVAGAISAKQSKAAAKAAALPAPIEITLSDAMVDATYPDCYLMERDGGADASVNVNSVDIMKNLGWLLKAKTK